ncbi:PH and SEC7 domain-containing protein isoform X2 [Bacillus rossius redtenbacheri]|uniref:PH and SEC7 domain-containing protein isoform X2 n=1 Tax=Bacillus rossius redtenbacheri TaxID=93214 RepID=UPI002FDE398E
MAEELLVVLRRSDSCGLGFSLLGTAGLPPIIYDIIENSPAAESGEVEAGDVILKVNETDVNRFSTKEVLKCLRLSTDPVTLKLKRDPVIKERVRHYLSSPQQLREEDLTEFVAKEQSRLPTLPDLTSPSDDNATGSRNGTCSELEALLPPDSFEEVDRTQWEPLSSNDKFSRPRPPRFEAFMMTGDVILNLSRTQQSSGLLPKHQKKVDSLRYHHHHHHYHNHHHHHNNSVPTSPNEMELGHRNHHHHKLPSGTNSAGTSPVGPNKRDSAGPQTSGVPCCPSGTQAPFPGFVRTSRSEDHLQFQKDSSISAVDIDIDEDVTSSLNTLLDTRPDSGGSNDHDKDRIVWTYNAPVSSPGSPSSSEDTSPRRSLSPQSPTSVSSSVMSSNSSSRGGPAPSGPLGGLLQPNGELSQSEAVSNISSPDFQEEETLDILSTRDLMEVSDPSDSDSTLLVSDRVPAHPAHPAQDGAEHRIVIQVKGPDKDSRPPAKPQRPGNGLELSVGGALPSRSPSSLSSGNVTPELVGYQLRESEDELTMLGDEPGFPGARATSATSATSPPASEDDSDIESLHSFHYSPKAVDIPSAVRLAKRLYMLDGFKRSDVSRHLSKNNDFSRAVAEEYLKYFSFESNTLDVALRKFLKQFSLAGETQERERVLVHFSKRYLDCNPGTFNSQDAVHTLTCAIMLLNTDLHGQNLGRKMTCSEFIDNLCELNDGENFPREVLKSLYQAIKNYPLEWALDEEGDEVNTARQQLDGQHSLSGSNPFLEIPDAATAIEYKKGYVMRKCCIDGNGKKTPFGKRGWKMFYCTLRDMVLYLHKDEHGFRKSALSDNLHNAIRIHHALATKAADYTKKQHVFRLQTADQAEYLFQTSDSKELQSWIDTINLVCASFSAQPLAGAVGSQRKFQRPLLPCSHTKLSLREQLRDHEERVQRLETELEDHRKHPPERNAKSLAVQNYKEKDAFLHFELKRYKTYAYLLRSRVAQFPELDVPAGAAEGDDCVVPPPVPDRRSAANRYSYRAAIYSAGGGGRDNGGDLG